MMAITISLIFSKLIFSSYKTEQVMASAGNIYYLQYGVFTSHEVMDKNINKLENYLVYEIDNKYYVYLGIYANIDIAKKIKKIYEEEGIYTYIKNDYITDSELIDIIHDGDNSLLDTENTSELLEINNKTLNLIKKRVS